MVLDAGTYDLDSVAAQVEVQNAKIGSQITALTELLQTPDDEETQR